MATSQNNYQPMMKSYSLKGSGQQCQVKMMTEDGYQICSDTPIKQGGQGEYAQPIQLFLTSLVGCELATARYIANQMGVKIFSIDFDIQAERDEWGARHIPVDESAPVVARLQRIWGTALVDTDGTEEQVQTLKNIVKIRCPVANMVVLSGCKLEVEWKKK
ncbi:hypothetical protein ABPG72_014067 [Tetrahymena utriculariae]